MGRNMASAREHMPSDEHSTSNSNTGRRLRADWIDPRPRMQREGLYDPFFEHDSCGVGFVVNVDGQEDPPDRRQRHHDTEKPRPPRRGGRRFPHRGRGGHARADAPPFLRARGGSGSASRSRRRACTARQCSSSRRTRRSAPARGTSSRTPCPPEGAPCSAGARCPSTPISWESWPSPPCRTSPRPSRLSGSFSGDALERKLYVTRKVIESMAAAEGFSMEELYVNSFSCRTVVYKGMFVAPQFESFYPDLRDPDFESALAVIHQRYSTNTFPSWPLAQPFRYIAHNGEINTLRGNINKMNARELTMSSPLFGEDIAKLAPVIQAGPERLGHLRQRAGAPRHRREVPGARPHDDGARGLRPALPHERGQARLLRVPRGHHGAVGRPGGHLLQRRHQGRIHPGQERPAARPLGGHAQRPGRPGLRGRRPGHPAGGRAAEGPPGAGQDVPGGHGAEADHLRQRGEGGRVPAQAVPPLAGGQPHRAEGAVPGLGARAHGPRAACRRSTGCSATPWKTSTW